MRLTLTFSFLVTNTIISLLILSGCEQGGSQNSDCNSHSGWERSDFTTRVIVLYFWSMPAGHLVPVWEEIPVKESVSKTAMDVLHSLSVDSSSEILSPIPSSMKIIDIYYDGEGKIFVDIAYRTGLRSGSRGEKVAFSAMCRSIMENLPEVDEIEFISTSMMDDDFGTHIIPQCM